MLAKREPRRTATGKRQPVQFEERRDALVERPVVSKLVRQVENDVGLEAFELLSDRDLLLYGNPVRDVELEFPGLPVSKVMTTDVITCRPDASVSEVIGLMLAHKVNAIPLVDESDNLLGLVSSTDFLALLSDSEKSHPLPFQFEVQPPS